MSASAKGPMGFAAGTFGRPGVSFDIKIADPAERIQAFIDGYQNPISEDGAPGFDDVLMSQHIRLVSANCTADRATAVFSLFGGQYLTNRVGSIHGGAVALIYDMCTTMCAAPLARKGFWEFGGVSRNLSVTYLRAAKPDMDIIIKCEVLHMGSRLATIKGEMVDRSTGSLLSTAEHNKASIATGNKM